MQPSPDQERPRIFRRELRRKNRHPKRCDSLPSLHLAPETRPVYVCQRCQFPNVLSSLCPWCFTPCTCDTTALVAAVRHRVSSPALLTDAQKMQLARIERQAHGMRSSTRAAFLVVATSSPGPHGATRHLPAAGALAPEGKAETASDNPLSQCDDVRRRHRNAVLYSATDVVATATSDTTLQPFLDEIAAAHQENRERERRSVFSTTTVTTSSSPTLSRTPRPQTPRTPTPRSRTRMSDRDDDLPHTSEHTPSKPSAPPSPSSVLHASQTPCLRRKRRMPVLRQRSSCSLRRRATLSSVGTHCRDSASSSPSSPRHRTAPSLSNASSPPRAKSPTSIKFSTPPPIAAAAADAIPLGHPQRPLYTAIRKNMSRPESPSPPPPGARPNFDAAFQTLVYDRQTRSLDIEPPRYGSLSRASHLALSSSSPSHSHSPHSHSHPRARARGGLRGCSVSGETELRMDLARCRSMDGVPSDFAFREVRPAQDASVKARVKSFGKTLKGLLRKI